MPEQVNSNDTPVECFFCSGHLPCRSHKPLDFADVDFQMFVMGDITAEELFELQGVES